MPSLAFNTLAALVVFAFVTSITPGPSNLMALIFCIWLRGSARRSAVSV